MLEDIQYVDIPCNDNLYDNAREQIIDLLKISGEENLLYVAHPRHIFSNIVEDKRTKLITKVDWNSVDMERMTRFDDYGKFSLFDQIYRSNNQFSYLNNRFSNMLRKYRIKGNSELVYPLAIVEQVRGTITGMSSFVPRGIICAKQDGILICNKVKSMEEINNNSFQYQKKLRMSR